jgi:hypothetical protein
MEKLIVAGWSKPHIALTTHIAARFAALNRIVVAFGLPSQNLLDLYLAHGGNDGIGLANGSNNGQ